jgi:hypothetical protein
MNELGLAVLNVEGKPPPKYKDLHEEALATGICRCGHPLHGEYNCSNRDHDGCPCDCFCRNGSAEYDEKDY